MASKKQSPADVLKSVIESLEPLDPKDQHWVLQSAASFLSVEPPVGGGRPPASHGAGHGAHDRAVPLSQQDPKSFIKAKNPTTDGQRVACLAYYLTNARSVQQFKTADIRKLNTDAKGPTFNVPRAVDNAAKSQHGYLSSVGKGFKQITAHGEEVVDALPDKERVKEVESNRKKPRKGRTKKKAKAG